MSTQGVQGGQSEVEEWTPAAGWGSFLAKAEMDNTEAEHLERLQAAHDFQLDRHTKCWEALCSIGEALNRAGYPILIPERAMKVGEQVDAMISDVRRLREATRLEWAPVAGGAKFILVLQVGELPINLLSVTPDSSGLWLYQDGYPSLRPDWASRESTEKRVGDFHRSRKLPCPLPPFPVCPVCPSEGVLLGGVAGGVGIMVWRHP